MRGKFSAILRSLTLAMVLGAIAVPAHAQHVATTTTTTAAMSATQNFMLVTSATDFTVGYQVWAGRELMAIVSVSGLRIGVRRAGNTQSHASGAKVTVSSETGNSVHFRGSDPTTLNAGCTRGTGEAGVVPWVNTATGVVWVCGLDSAWRGGVMARITYNSEPVYTQ